MPSTNEGEKEDHDGLHQWNLTPQDDGDLVLWGPGVEPGIISAGVA